MDEKGIVDSFLEFYTYRIKFLEDARELIANKLAEEGVDHTKDKMLNEKFNELDQKIDILKKQVQEFKDKYGLD